MELLGQDRIERLAKKNRQRGESEGDSNPMKRFMEMFGRQMKGRRVGSNDLRPVDVRGVCASKANLLKLCEEGHFLEDFF